MTTEQRLREALEELRASYALVVTSKDSDRMRKAKDSAIAALAQSQAQDTPSLPEPVAWLLRHGTFRHYSGGMVHEATHLLFNKPEKNKFYDGCDEWELTPLYAAPPSLPVPTAEQQEKP
jgi:hypothetical protein